MSEILLQTKLYVPPLRPSLVPRPRLINKIIGGQDYKTGYFASKLTLVSAPAGFGKTTLVIHALKQQERVAAWLSLDEGDNNPIRFHSYLLAAIQTICPEVGQSLFASLNSPQPPEEKAIPPALINELVSHTAPLVLVLDDYHVINNETIHQGLAFIIDYAPSNLHLILTSREDPPLPLPRWRLRGQLNEIHVPDLRFTPAEAGMFFEQTMGMHLDETAVSALRKWPSFSFFQPANNNRLITTSEFFYEMDL